MDLTVVKVGGRLGRGQRLRGLAARLADVGRRHRLLLVPGGGAFADAVRDMDAREGLSASTAHWMAVLAMDQYGLALADLIAGAHTVTGCRPADTAPPGTVRVLLPAAWLRRVDPLPHTWSVTSDAIALWVTRECGASTVVLLKDEVGMATPLRPGEGPPRGHVSASDLASWAALDRHSGALLDGLTADLWIVDGEAPGRLEELLDTGACAGVRLRRPPP